MKTCSKCKISKTESEYFRSSKAKDGLHHLCQPCNRAYKKQRYHSMTKEQRAFHGWRWKTLKKYGITQEEFVALKKSCEICGSTDNLKIDHDHSLSQPHVRGILCHSCNVGIGHFRDDTSLLENAIKYLNKKPKPPERSGLV